jgi:short-subunit dehydrogenase
MDFLKNYGPWAVVAGASEGTGRAIARELASKGLPSVLVARREAPLITLRDEILAEFGIQCDVALVDLAAPEASERLIEAVGDKEIGLFVSNAGADTNGSRFLERDLTAWVDLVNLNVMTMMKSCYHFAAPMRARGKGGLLLINSGACYGGLKGMAAYTASKAFMLCFSEALWGELHPDGVDVLTLVLGQTDTPAYRKLLAEKNWPLPTSWASPEAVAKRGLERLKHGPVHNWGQEDDVAGYAPNSPEARRQRVLSIG